MQFMCQTGKTVGMRNEVMEFPAYLFFIFLICVFCSLSLGYVLIGVC